MAYIPARNAAERAPLVAGPGLPGAPTADSIAVGSAVGAFTLSVIPSRRHFFLHVLDQWVHSFAVLSCVGSLVLVWCLDAAEFAVPAPAAIMRKQCIY